jgi:hypothetical protein
MKALGPQHTADERQIGLGIVDNQDRGGAGLYFVPVWHHCYYSADIGNVFSAGRNWLHAERSVGVTYGRSTSMRITLLTLVLALLAIPGNGQTDRTYYFTQPTSAKDMAAVTTTIRTVVDLQDIVPDEEHHALKAHGPVDKLLAADWLFQQLEHPGPPNAAAEYKLTDDPHQEVIHIFRVSPAASTADITALVTAIRTLADIQRLFPLADRKTIVGRESPEKLALADWMVRQLSPPEGEAPTEDSPPYPTPAWPGSGPEMARIWRMAPSTTAAQLTSTITAIRTIADLQRMFPFESSKALLAKGSVDRMAVADWIVHELAKPVDPGTAHQTSLPGPMDSSVRLFFLAPQTSTADLTTLVTKIRAELDIRRMFPLAAPPAVVLRGRPDQMPAAEAMVAKFVADNR